MNQENLEKLKKLSLKDPIIKEAYDELIMLYADPTKIFFRSINSAVFKISAELDSIKNGEVDDETKEYINAPILTGDDKLFDRIFKLMTQGDEVFDTLRKAKADIDPESVKKEKEREIEDSDDVSFLDKKANNKRK